MPAFAQISVADAETVPVTHVFSPDKIDPSGVAFLENRVTGIVKKFETMSLSNVRPKLDTGVRKVRVRVDLPYFDTVDPQLKLGSVGFDGVFLLPMNSPLQMRKNINQMVYNLMAINPLISLVQTGDNIW